MKLLKNITFLFLLSILSFAFLYLESYAASVFDGIETQINPDSGSEKIKKLQNLFKDLKLYSGEITGKYEDIESTIIRYQLKKGLVTHSEDWGAGYFGKKTILALKNDFPEDFENKSKIHLKQEEVLKGKTSFVITAYYSPLTGQRKYITGSYSGDIRLNGGGKITASGKGVFPGLLAAPKNYDFGTRIYFEGIGIGVVEDRGGAIVNAGDKGHASDRIDIWMGYGDEGLSRAIRWGKRTVKGEILEDFYSYNITFDPSKLTKYYPIRLSPVTSSRNQIISMQKLFTDLGLYHGTIDGNYSSIKEAVIDFQLKNGIISSRNVDDAGYIGPKTANFLEKKYPAGIFREQGKSSLSLRQKKQLDATIIKIELALEKKAGGNRAKLNVYRKKVITSISDLILSTNNKVLKLKLDYLKNNI